MKLKELLPDYQHYDINWLISETENAISHKFIYFWGHTSKTPDRVGKECFSQWYPAPFTINGVLYKTAEHWMMARKALLFDNKNLFAKIIASEKPGEAKDLGRRITGFDEQTWVAARYDIVKLGNMHKFNQHPALLEFLLSSEHRVLVEASPVDKIWGVGLSQDSEDIYMPHIWPGLNLLGFALMEVRDFLQTNGKIRDTAKLLPPPWIQYPDISPLDMFWRMGIGEEYITAHASQYEKLDQKTKMEYMLNNPVPPEWSDYYSAA